MAEDALLPRPVVVGRHHQRRVGTGGAGGGEVLGGDAGVVAAGAGDHRHAPARLVDADPHDVELLGEGQRRRLAGGAARDQAGRPLRHLPLDQVAIGALVEAAVGGEGRDQRRDGPFEPGGLNHDDGRPLAPKSVKSVQDRYGPARYHVHMVASGLRAGIVSASLLAVAASGQDTLDRYRQQMTTMPAVQPIPAPEDGSIAATIAQWRALQQTDALPFDSYAGFLMAHPGWPGETANRRAAERQAAAGTASAGNVAAYFNRFPPTGGPAWAADARALAATGQTALAAAAVHKAWRSASLSANDESYLLTAFPGVLNPDDHDARVDALLWAGQTGAATRLMGMTSLARRPVLTARLALRSAAPDAPSIAAANAYAGDAGFVADRAAFLKNSGQWDAARQALAGAHRFAAAPSNPAVWLDTLWANARAAAADRQWQLAYDIGRQVDDAYPIGTDVGALSYGERDDYTNLAWTAARAALKQLGRPADAMTLFDRYGPRLALARDQGQGVLLGGPRGGGGRATTSAPWPI